MTKQLSSDHQAADNWSLIRRMLRENARERWGKYLIAFLLMMMTAAMTGLFAYIMEDVINEVFVGQRESMVLAVALSISAIFILRGIGTYASAVILARIGNAIVADLQRRVFDTLLAQELAFFERQSLADLIVRFQAGVMGVRAAIEMLVTSIGRDIFTLLALIVVMIVQDPIMSFLALIVAPPAVWGIRQLMRRVRGYSRKEFVTQGNIVSTLKEAAQGMRVLKSFGLEHMMTTRMGTSISEVQRLQNKMAKAGSLTSPLMDTLGGFALAGTIVYGGWRIINDGMDPGSLFSFLTAFLLAYEPAKRLARFNVVFQNQLVASRKVYDLLDLERSAVEQNTGPDLTVQAGEVRFKDVAFSYDDGTPAVSDVSVTMAPGTVTALVGPSGGGKSTLLALIARLRLPTSGQILVDDQDIALASARSVRSAIAVVSQDTFLFEGSVRENIRMGRKGASDAEVETVAVQANAHDFVMRLPDGYDSAVGEGGGLLSGGQRQRVAIARAMLADTPILLLDEATSALDSVSESKVLEALETLMRGRTTVVIAHRLSTVRHADIVHVVDQGRIVESGNHPALLKQGGLYAHLYKTQLTE